MTAALRIGVRRELWEHPWLYRVLAGPSLWFGLAVALLLAGLATGLRRRQSAL